jgi:hypothetical protein
MMRIEEGGGEAEDGGVGLEVVVEELRKEEEEEVKAGSEGMEDEASVSIPGARRVEQ